MPNNVLGYNRTSSSYRGKIYDIHLRLRRPGTHELIDYESIAATMCHELAHCVRGPHDAHFYKVNSEYMVSCNLPSQLSQSNTFKLSFELLITRPWKR